MTRERKELIKKLERLEMQQAGEYELSCGFCTEEIEKAFHPAFDALYNAWAATYGRTQKEHADYVFNKQNAAYEAGRIQWPPYYYMTMI